jgi:ABC-2 type transport system ATP-binding protein
MEEAERLCDRVAIIDRGQVIALDTPRALIDGLGGGILHLGILDGKIDAVVDCARVLPDVKTVRRIDHTLEIETHHAQNALVALLGVTNRLDATVTALEVLQPNLETVFLRLTGNKLRD